MLDRRFEYWLTLTIGVFAAGTWVSQAVRALNADGELSAKGLFAWMAATIAGVAIGVVAGMLTAGLRARQTARQMARGGPHAVWDMDRSALIMGIFVLGWGTDPIFTDPHSLWTWAYSLVAATLAGIMFGIGFLLRDERRLLIPPSTYYPPAPSYPPSAGYWHAPGGQPPTQSPPG
jgi:hypothetical protein